MVLVISCENISYTVLRTAILTKNIDFIGLFGVLSNLIKRVGKKSDVMTQIKAPSLFCARSELLRNLAFFPERVFLSLIWISSWEVNDFNE